MTVSNQEVQAIQYYVHNSYVPSWYYVYEVVESWIASKIFRKDLTRCFLSSDDYVFRRRFELTDMSKDYTTLDASSLNFPFANYNPLNVGWTADPTIAANTAALVYKGIYVGDTIVKAAASIMKLPVTFYFDREDDARLAFDTLYFYSYNRHYYSIDIPYGSYGSLIDGSIPDNSNTLALPVNILISNLQFNPKFKEKDWLKQNRIYTITCTFDIKTYAIKPPEQPEYTQRLNTEGYLTDKDGNILYDESGNPLKYKDGTQFYYVVQDVILNFLSKQGYTYTAEGKENFPTTGEEGIFYIDSSVTDASIYDTYNDLPTTGTAGVVYLIKSDYSYYTWDEDNQVYASLNIHKFNPNIYIWSNEIDEDTESVRGYILLSEAKSLGNIFDVDAKSLGVSGSVSSNSIKLDYLRVTNITSSSAVISWKYNETFTSETPASISITVNGTTVSVDTTATSYTIKDLTSESNYIAYVTFVTQEGKSKTLSTEFKTKVDTSAVSKKKMKPNDIIGYEW